MKIFVQWLLVFILAAILLAYISGEAADKQTNRLYARAHLVDSQSSARQDTLAAMMPYAILGVATIGGVIAIIALVAGIVAVVAIWSSRPATQPVREIERQMIIMLQPGQTRREVWRQVSEIKLIKGN